MVDSLYPSAACPVDAATQRRQMQTVLRAFPGIDARSSAVIDTRVHQHGDSSLPAEAMAHPLGPPHKGHVSGRRAAVTRDPRSQRRRIDQGRQPGRGNACADEPDEHALDDGKVAPALDGVGQPRATEAR